jgi:signal transduction histidine kinase
MVADNNNMAITPSIAESVLLFMRQPVLILDASNRLIMANEPARQLIGMSDTITADHFHISTLFADANHIIHQSKSRSDVYAATLKRANGGEFFAQYSFFAVGNAQQPEARVFFFEDVTSQKRIEATVMNYANRIEKKNKELDQFAYVVSHDLKAPLRAINNLSLWLTEDLAETITGENLKNLNTLRSRVTRLESLINGILEYSRVGRTDLPDETVDVLSLVEEIEELLQPPAHIHIEVVSELPVIQAPKILLFQVFSNLIGNAIKYHDKSDGFVKISSVEHNDHIEFAVEDNGPGIPEEYFDQIFVIFQTLQSKDKFESTGIGLTLVKRIVEERGGQVRIESTVGKGSRFTVIWPNYNPL